MKSFVFLSLILLVVSCGRRTNNNAHDNQFQSALVVQNAINTRCSEQSVARRCSIGISQNLLPPSNFLNAYCYELYRACIARGF